MTRTAPWLLRGRSSLVAAAALLAAGSGAEAQSTDDPLRHSVEQLRASIGTWRTVTEFLNPDGTMASVVEGTYEFSWIVPDRVVAGRSEIPELQQAAGILFYVSQSREAIEMVSVGADGYLWVMTGPLGGEERVTQEFRTVDGGTQRLRFTRFNVAADSFESRMEYTLDEGRTWTPGNHQTFTRASRGQ